ncbi:5-deoxy-glucuronate isomerase [Meiothermus luteus]|jgi:5-deoxy-glucuronate isomerase|uniref:5-deoxy-glucuronate isomerase n=1 Tax=Meiothermus luteus TaxID=2026184 RepID=A0A399EZK3_9DEIN|nr:5-deoxy-glucuronate isomerase [Meiothermus luteus]RIH88469.1 5-deoxy-glucuronate isomerase [Meiothermus luteus]RMH57331.1 MAG: 5-deoxy-glucuronate isomerase [Deinococcota bacterium]
MRYFHTLPKGPGYHPLPDQSCKLLAFAKLNLEPHQQHQGETGDREALLVVLSGQARVQVEDKVFAPVGGRPNVFAGLPHSVYLPRGVRYRVEALSRLEAALPSAPSDLKTEPYEIRPEQVRTGQWGTLNFSRQFREILVQPNGLPASRLIVGETITPSGNWSTYPPHKHEVEEGGEVFHEEMYYFRLSSPEGFGLVRHYSPERGYDQTYTVRDETLLAIPHGYHTYVGAPGYTSYYLWFLAGEGRTQGVRLDPEVGWVQKTVGMF